MKHINYKRILNFIARRAGYSGWKLDKSWIMVYGLKNTFSILKFTCNGKGKSYYDGEVAYNQGSSLHLMIFENASKPNMVLKRLLKFKDNVVVYEGPYKCKDASLSFSVLSPCMKLFKDHDTIESLEIEAELCNVQ